jgi:ABC-type dipeptide/oligopeptide/nickel transport system ATPase component
VLITHDLGLAAGRVTRLLVMNAGRIIEDRPTSELLAAPRTTQAASLCAHRNWLALPC